MKYWADHPPSRRSLGASDAIAGLLRLADDATTGGGAERIALEVQLLPGLTSIVEEFFRERLVDHFAAKVAELAEPWVQPLWRDREETIDRGWDGIKQAWSQLAGINLSAAGGANWERFDAVREVRNAYVHGSGNLTRRQLKTRSRVLGTLAKLRPFGVDVVADRIQVARPFLRVAAGSARKMIVDIDEVAVVAGFATV